MLATAIAEAHQRPGEARTTSLRVVGAIALPALAGMMVVAPDFVAVVLGGKWHAAVPVIQILTWVGALQSLQGLNSSVLQARDRTQDLLRYGIVVCTASLGAFAVGLHWGLLGVAVAYAISSTAVEPYYTWLTARCLGLPVLAFPRALAGVVQATAGMAAAAELCRMALVSSGVPAAPRLGLVVLAGLIVYLPLALWRVPELRVFLGRLRRPRTHAAPVEPALP